MSIYTGKSESKITFIQQTIIYLRGCLMVLPKWRCSSFHQMPEQDTCAQLLLLLISIYSVEPWIYQML